MPANPRAASVRLKAAGKAALLAAWHDMRSGHVPAHIDAAAAGQNSVLQPPPGIDEIHRLAERRFAAAQLERRATGKKPRRKRPENASPAYTALITFGREAQGFLATLDPASQDAALEEALAAVAGYLDVPVLWATVHRDESAIHLHAGLCAVRSNGLSISTATAGYSGDARRNTSELQDVLHQALQPHLPALERGTKLIDRLKAGERPEPTRSHHQLRRDLGLPPDAQRNDVQAAVQELRKAEATTEALRKELAGLEVRRNRIPHFTNAQTEIKAGRMRPLEAHRQWKVETGTEATAGIEACHFTKPEWAALRDWQGAHDHQRAAKEAARKAEKDKQEAREAAEKVGEEARSAARRRDEIEAELAKAELLEMARQQIAEGHMTPGETPGTWALGGKFDRASRDEIWSKLTGDTAKAIWPEIRRIGEMVSRQNRLPLFNAAMDEIAGGRMVPLAGDERQQTIKAHIAALNFKGCHTCLFDNARPDFPEAIAEITGEIERRQLALDSDEPWWKVETRTDATDGIEACRFTRPEWAHLLDWQGAHGRRRAAKEAASEAEEARQAARAAAEKEEEAGAAVVQRRRAAETGLAKTKAALAKAELLELARLEITAGRVAPGEDAGTWVQAGKYDGARWDEIWSKLTGDTAKAIWPEIRRIGEMVAARDGLEKAAAEIEAETVALATAHEEIAAGNIRPQPAIGRWFRRRNLDADREKELGRKLSCDWRPYVWQRLQEFAAACTATVQDQLAELQGRISKAMDLARQSGNQEIINALSPPQPEAPAATLFCPKTDPEPNTPDASPSPSP